VQIADGDTGDLISLTDINNNALYAVALEISPARPRGHTGVNIGGTSPYYDDDDCSPTISASLADYISIVDVGTIQIMIPKSVMQTLRARTYDVFLTIDPNGVDDGRQLLIGRLPVLYGGRNT
jgi:hypothetical protein